MNEDRASPPHSARLEQERKLREFGLAEYASRAYLALLQLGTSEARVISRVARVPVAKIYSTLDQLAERGLCVIEPGPPKRFTPLPIDRFLDRVAAQHDEQALQAREAKESALDLFRMPRADAADDRGTFQVHRGRQAAFDRLRQMCAGAESDVLLLASDQAFARRSVARMMLEGAQARGVRVRVLARVDAETSSALADLCALADFRAKEPGSGHITVGIFDEARALVIHHVPDDGSTMRGNDVALYTDEEAIVGVLFGFLERQWTEAETLADARARVERGQPRRYQRALGSAVEAGMALARATEQGAMDHRGLGHTVHDTLLERAAPVERSRLVLRIDSLEDARAAEALQHARPGLEIRHARVPPGFEYDLVDGRVALMAFRTPGEVASYTLTNDARTVWGLFAHFDEAWRDAVPVHARRLELESEGETGATVRVRE